MPIIRGLTGLTAGLITLGALAGPAAAHVTVNPREQPKGGYAKLAFRTPNERPDSGTVKLEIVLPVEHPITSVSVRPHPYWKFTTEKTKLATPVPREGGDPVTEVVSKITWTGGTINPGEFDEFEVSAGPLPKNTDQLVFKAVQTYASGEVVSWIEEAVPGGSEPERPAPILKLTDAATQVRAAPAAAEPVAATSAAPDSAVDSARALAVTALGLGALALLLGIAAILRRRPSRVPDAGTTT